MGDGLAGEEAERIIVQGFFEPVLQRIPLENLRTRLRRSIVHRMSGSFESEADTWVDAQERWEVEGVGEYAVSLDNKPAEEEIRLMEHQFVVMWEGWRRMRYHTSHSPKRVKRNQLQNAY